MAGALRELSVGLCRGNGVLYRHSLGVLPRASASAFMAEWLYQRVMFPKGRVDWIRMWDFWLQLLARFWHPLCCNTYTYIHGTNFLTHLIPLSWFPSSSWSCRCPCGCGSVVKRYILQAGSGSGWANDDRPIYRQIWTSATQHSIPHMHTDTDKDAERFSELTSSWGWFKWSCRWSELYAGSWQGHPPG